VADAYHGRLLHRDCMAVERAVRAVTEQAESLCHVRATPLLSSRRSWAKPTCHDRAKGFVG
jgi:hypothetical protein